MTRNDVHMHAGKSRRWRARLAAVLVVPALLVSLAACSSENDGLTQQFREGSDKGFISGDGRVVEIPAGERGEPVAFTGVSELGETLSSEEYLGEVLVVNFWYAGCAPCRAEAADLEAVHQQYAGAGASFMGVNIYDQPDTALTFAKEYGVTYPSAMATGDGPLKMAFAAVAPLQATPTTLVIDASGRVAARIVGPIEGTSTLSTLVRDTIAEGAAADEGAEGTGSAENGP